MRIRLKLDGRPFVLRMPPGTAVPKFLDAAPVDELFSTGELAQKLGIETTAIASAANKIGKQYRQSIGRDLYWGNPTAIAELRKQVGA